MTTRKAPETDLELVNAFGELFEEVPVDSIEEANAILRAAGYDPAATGKRLQGMIEQALATSPLNWRNQKSLLDQARERLSTMRKWRYNDRAELNEAVQELLSLLPQSQPLAAHYRNFQEMEDEDMNTWLDELAYLVETGQDTE